MPTLDWNKWADAWSAVFPKNEMWGKIRSGEHDPVTGEPLYRWDRKPNTEATDPELAAVIAEHRFVAPAVYPEGQQNDWENCFCGWAGEHHGDHLQEKVNEFVDPPREEDAEEPAPKKAAPKKAAAKTEKVEPALKVEKADDEDADK